MLINLVQPDDLQKRATRRCDQRGATEDVGPRDANGFVIRGRGLDRYESHVKST